MVSVYSAIKLRKEFQLYIVWIPENGEDEVVVVKQKKNEEVLKDGGDKGKYLKFCLESCLGC